MEITIDVSDDTLKIAEKEAAKTRQPLKYVLENAVRIHFGQEPLVAYLGDALDTDNIMQELEKEAKVGHFS